MSRRPATLTQADVRRVIRAAKQEGANSIEVQPDGRIVIQITADESALAKPVEILFD